MCIADWQLGRLIRAEVRRIVISGSGGVILRRHKDRVAVTFVNDNAYDVNIIPELAAAAGVGFFMSPPVFTGSGTNAISLTAVQANSAVTLTSADTLISANYTGSVTNPDETLTGTIANGGSNGIQVPHLHFTLKDYGDLPMRQWSAISGSETDTMTIIEYTLPEDVLHLTPEELRQRS